MVAPMCCKCESLSLLVGTIYSPEHHSVSNHKCPCFKQSSWHQCFHLTNSISPGYHVLENQKWWCVLLVRQIGVFFMGESRRLWYMLPEFLTPRMSFNTRTHGCSATQEGECWIARDHPSHTLWCLALWCLQCQRLKQSLPFARQAP